MNFFMHILFKTKKFKIRNRNKKTNWMNAGHLSPPIRHVVNMIRKRLATRGPTPKVIELQLLLMSIIIYLYL